MLDHMEDRMTAATTQLRNNNKRMAELVLEVWTGHFMVMDEL